MYAVIFITSISTAYLEFAVAINPHIRIQFDEDPPIISLYLTWLVLTWLFFLLRLRTSAILLQMMYYPNAKCLIIPSSVNSVLFCNIYSGILNIIFFLFVLEVDMRLYTLLYPPHNEVVCVCVCVGGGGGGGILVSLRPSVCPSVPHSVSAL